MSLKSGRSIVAASSTYTDSGYLYVTIINNGYPCIQDLELWLQLGLGITKYAQ